MGLSYLNSEPSRKTAEMKGEVAQPFPLLFLNSLTSFPSSSLPKHQAYFCFSFLILISGFFLIKYTTHVKERKRMAWILSLITSCVCVTLCLVHVIELCYIHNFNIIDYDIYRDDELSLFIVLFFISSMMIDLILGQFYYRETIDPLSGYFHHIFYIFLLMFSVLENFTLAFVIFLPLEIPTIILSLGSIYPNLRSDLWFGLTFSITRIIYHLVLLYNILRVDFITRESRIQLWPFCGLAFVLHVYWLKNWFQGYIRRANRSAQEYILEQLSADFRLDFQSAGQVRLGKSVQGQQDPDRAMKRENGILNGYGKGQGQGQGQEQGGQQVKGQKKEKSMEDIIQRMFAFMEKEHLLEKYILSQKKKKM